MLGKTPTPISGNQTPFVVETKEVLFSRSLTRVEKLCENPEIFYNNNIY